MRVEDKDVLGLKGLCLFVLVAVVGLCVSYYTPLRDELNVEQVRVFAQYLGYWGPLTLLVLGTVTPLLFLPRWPVCFVAGLLYGVVWGGALANVACTMGAWVHYVTARHLVSRSSKRLLQKWRLNPDKIPRDKAFLCLFTLRVFPLSNSAATNVLAGALRLSTGSYLLATFIGMMPSTLLYTAWGKLMKKPGPSFYYLAVVVLVLMIGGALLAKRHLGAWLAGKGKEAR